MRHYAKAIGAALVVAGLGLAVAVAYQSYAYKPVLSHPEYFPSKQLPERLAYQHGPARRANLLMNADVLRKRSAVLPGPPYRLRSQHDCASCMYGAHDACTGYITVFSREVVRFTARPLAPGEEQPLFSAPCHCRH